MSDTIWYVYPRYPNTNEAIAALLQSNSISPEESQVASITVNGTVYPGVYRVAFWVVRKIEESEHHDRVYIFVKKGGAKTKKWGLQGKSRRPLSRTKAVKDIKKKIKK